MCVCNIYWFSINYYSIYTIYNTIKRAFVLIKINNNELNYNELNEIFIFNLFI